ncbi:MAG: DUF1080 domain-containing protein [Luteolibacter sp.]
MKTLLHLRQVSGRFGLTAVVCLMGVLVVGTSGCGKKEAAVDQAPSTPEAAPPAAANSSEGWMEMETLGPNNWEAINGAADLSWDTESKIMQIGVGTDLNGVRWTGPLPVAPYVVEMEARRMSGNDFFCGLTFPVRTGTECVSLIVGGWGGSLVGISSIDGLDASENPTGSQHEFENQRWYRIRVEVTTERLQAWIDDRQVVNVETEGRRLSLREGPIEDCAPWGLATWMTRAEVRGVRWRKLGL